MNIESVAVILVLLFVLSLGAILVLLFMRQKDREKITSLENSKQILENQISWIEITEKQIKESFKSLSLQALSENSEKLTSQTKKEVSGVITPIAEELSKLDKNVRSLEAKRAGAYKSLEDELDRLAKMHRELSASTTTLSQALRSPTVRGRWGEIELRRIVELSGMSNHVSFDEQISVTTGRPDMIVHIPSGGQLPIDSKVPLDSYLSAMETDEIDKRKTLLKSHSTAMKSHVRTLGSKAYWEQFDTSPEFVVMFVPNESCLSAAFEHDQDLLEYALKNRVLITSPVNLIALLKTVAYGWQQRRVTEEARSIFEAGMEFQSRAKKFIEHFESIGSGLAKATSSFNNAISSYQKRLLPSAKRLEDLSSISKTDSLPDLGKIEETPSFPEDPPIKD